MRGQEHYRKLIMIYSNFPYLPIIVGKSDDFTDGYPLIILWLKCKFCRLYLRATYVGLSKAQAKKKWWIAFSPGETFSLCRWSGPWSCWCCLLFAKKCNLNAPQDSIMVLNECAKRSIENMIIFASSLLPSARSRLCSSTLESWIMH